MINALLLLTEVVFGFLIFRPKGNTQLRFGGAAIIGISISQVFYFLTCFIFGNGRMHIAVHIIVLAAISTLLFKADFEKIILIRNWKQFIHLAIYAAIASIFSCKCYKIKDEFILSTTSIPIHFEISMFSSFSHGKYSERFNPFSIHHPDIVNHTVQSGFLSALHLSMMNTGKTPINSLMSLQFFILSWSCCVILYSYSIKLGLKPTIAFCIPYVVLFIHGYFIFDVADRPTMKNELVDWTSQTPSHGKTGFLHPLLHIFYSQQSNLQAMTIFILVLYFIEANQILPYIGIFAGITLPIIHHQTFITLLLYVLISFLFRCNLKQLLLNMIFSSLIHFPRIYYGIRQASFQPIFMDIPNCHNTATFLFNSFGLIPFLILFVAPFCLSKKDKIHILLPSVLCLFSLTKWGLQSNPIFNLVPIYSSFIVNGIVLFIKSIGKLSKRIVAEDIQGVIIGLATLIVILGMASSLFGLHVQLNNRKECFTESDNSLSEWIIKNTDKDALFITARELNEPATTLAGRQSFNCFQDLAEFEGFGATNSMNEKMIVQSLNNTESFIPEVQYFIRSKFEPENMKLLILNEKYWTDVFYHKGSTIYKRN